MEVDPRIDQGERHLESMGEVREVVLNDRKFKVGVLVEEDFERALKEVLNKML